MNERSFSVVIPTRDRCDTLEYALKTVTDQPCDQLEIIVCDNASIDETRQVVEKANDARIRYINPGKRLSMSDNWEFALSHVTGDWLTIIGDDDGLLPNVFDDVNQIIDSTGTEAIRSATCVFRWPELIGDPDSGRLTIPTKKGIEIINSKHRLKEVMLGKIDYTALPMLYNGGFVSMDAIRRGTKNDKFYRSCIPDIYSGVLFSHILDSFVYSYSPLAINGASAHSTGTSQFSAKRQSKNAVSPSAKFLQEPNIPYHPSYPLDANGEYPKSFLAMVFECMAQVSESFEGVELPSAALQLEYVMAAEERNELAVSEWGKKFSHLHDLDFAAIEKQARFRKKTRFLYDALRRLQNVNFFIRGSKENPIKNVHAAVSAAVEALANPDTLLRRSLKKLARKLDRN